MAARCDDPISLPPWLSTAGLRLTVVAVAAALVLLTNLGSAPLWDDDEPKNTSCTLSMLAHDDWVVPRFNETLRTDKPPLVNWLQMAGFASLGRNEAGARIASALLTIASSLLVAGIATRLFPSLPAVGLWSGLAMGSCAWSAVAGRAATPDASLCFATTLALFLFVWPAIPSARDSWRRAQPSLMHAAAIGGAIGLALLAKGPVGMVLPLGAFGLFCWWQAMADGSPPAAWARGSVGGLLNSGLAAWTRLRPAVVVLAAMAVAGPWVWLVCERTDGEWLRGFLFTHNVGRFSATMEGHSAPVFAYVVILVVGLFPWSIVAGVTAMDLVREVRSGRDAEALRLVACWIAVWVGCFSFSATKLPGYIWPAYPAVAVAVGWFLERWRLGQADPNGRWMPFAWTSLGLAGAAIVVGLFATFSGIGNTSGWLPAIGLVPIATAAVAWWIACVPHDARLSTMQARRGAALGCIAAGACLTVGVAVSVGPDLAGRTCGVRPLVAKVEAAGDSLRWASYRCNVPSLVYYCGASEQRRHVPRLAAPGEVARFYGDHPDAVVVTSADGVEELLGEAPSHHAVLARARSLSGHRQLVLVGPAHLHHRRIASGSPDSLEPR